MRHFGSIGRQFAGVGEPELASHFLRLWPWGAGLRGGLFVRLSTPWWCLGVQTNTVRAKCANKDISLQAWLFQSFLVQKQDPRDCFLITHFRLLKQLLQEGWFEACFL